jgi:hypothetical protein
MPEISGDDGLQTAICNTPTKGRAVSLADLQKTKNALAAVEEEIAAEEAKFHASIAGLREKKTQLEVELASGLRAELSAIGASQSPTLKGMGRPRGKIDDEKVVAAIRKRPNSPASYIFEQIDGPALGVSPASLSQKLKGMVDRGLLAKEGEKRGTRYRLP